MDLCMLDRSGASWAAPFTLAHVSLGCVVLKNNNRRSLELVACMLSCQYCAATAACDAHTQLPPWGRGFAVHEGFVIVAVLSGHSSFLHSLRKGQMNDLDYFLWSSSTVW